MIKNITVIDGQGRVCGKTYQKRAKGLVKKGRARFAGKTVIRLVQPVENQEEQNMDTTNMENMANASNTINMENIENASNTTNMENQAKAENVENQAKAENAENQAKTESASNTDMDNQAKIENAEDISRMESSQPDTAYIMKKIDQIMEESVYVKEALGNLSDLGEAGAIAAGNIIEKREQTNQAMIELLKAMARSLSDHTKAEDFHRILADHEIEDSLKEKMLPLAINKFF